MSLFRSGQRWDLLKEQALDRSRREGSAKRRVQLAWLSAILMTVAIGCLGIGLVIGLAVRKDGGGNGPAQVSGRLGSTEGQSIQEVARLHAIIGLPALRPPLRPSLRTLQ